MMRSWENRPDCRVVDEPLYACFLSRTGRDDPGRDEVIAAGETSWEAVVADLTAPVEGVYYQKHMAHHLLPEMTRDWVGLLTNVLLIRDPAQVVASYVRKRSEVADADLGLSQLAELHDQLGGKAPVIDAGDFLGDPEGYLRFICAHASVEFTPAMLAWPAGPRPSDGVWAKYWYDAALASTGFVPYKPVTPHLSPPAVRLVERLRPLYETLHAARVLL